MSVDQKANHIVDQKIEALSAAFTRQVIEAWGGALGGPVTREPAEPAAESGWSAVLSAEVTGETELTVWFDQAAVMSWVRVAKQLDADPGDDVVAGALGAIIEQAARGFEGTPEAGGCTWREGVVGPNVAPRRATWMTLSHETAGACRVAVAVAVPPSAAVVSRPVADHRLRAVLDVDLPLTVRFGRAVMPLRGVADLGPGAVIDMGRSPEEPVELLIGDRLIARGEVVVVGGNYGVRITELVGDRQDAARVENAS
jgi:flagellar motor switch protein FliN/FliY